MNSYLSSDVTHAYMGAALVVFQVDSSLSFLDEFVSEALAAGAAPYKPPHQRQEELARTKGKTRGKKQHKKGTEKKKKLSEGGRFGRLVCLFAS